MTRSGVLVLFVFVVVTVSGCGVLGFGADPSERLLDVAIEADENGEGVDKPGVYWVRLADESSITPGNGRGPVVLLVWSTDRESDERAADSVDVYGDCAVRCRESVESIVKATLLTDRIFPTEFAPCGNCYRRVRMTLLEVDLDRSVAMQLDRSNFATVFAPIDTPLEAALLLGDVHSVERSGDEWTVVRAVQEDPSCLPTTTTYEVWTVVEAGTVELMADRTVEREPQSCE